MEKIKNIFIKYKELILYIIIGGFTTVISLVSYYICVTTILNPESEIELQIANIISWICSVTFAYFTNRSIVFRSKQKSKFKESIKFVTSRLITLLIDMFFMFLFVSVININDKISKIIVQFIILVLNYIFSKFLVFNKKK